MAWGIVAGAVAAPLIGGLLGGASSGGSTSQSTQNKNPWEPAQPFLLKDLQTNQDLQNYYTKNPFNAQQRTGLQNTMGDADHYRSRIMPGLMDFANRGMTSSYSRQTGGAPGSGGGYGGAVRPGGMTQSGQGAFSAPTGGLFGQIDWNASNPFTNGHMAQAAAIREAADLERQRLALLQGLQPQASYYSPGDFGGDGGGSGGGDGGNGGAGTAGNAGGDGGPGGVGGW